MNNLTNNLNHDKNTEKLAINDNLSERSRHDTTDTLSTTTLNAADKLDTRLDNNALELLAEVPQVAKERIVTGNIKLSKQIKTQTINVPVILTQEVLVIEHTALPTPTNSDDLVQVIDNQKMPASSIMLDGKAVTLDEKPIEIVLSQQIAKVAIETQVAENVRIVTDVQTHEQSIPVTLRHEELVTEEVKLDNPKVIATEVIEDVNIVK